MSVIIPKVIHAEDGFAMMKIESSDKRICSHCGYEVGIEVIE